MFGQLKFFYTNRVLRRPLVLFTYTAAVSIIMGGNQPLSGENLRPSAGWWKISRCFWVVTLDELGCLTGTLSAKAFDFIQFYIWRL